MEILTGRFISAKGGATAVEFAMLAPVFFLLLFSTIEIGLIRFSQSSIKAGVDNLARAARVGDAQCFNDKTAIELVCAGAIAPNCKKKLNILKVSIAPSGAETPVSSFSGLKSGSVAMITASYDWNIIIPMIRPFFADAKGNLVIAESALYMPERFDARSCP